MGEAWRELGGSGQALLLPLTAPEAGREVAQLLEPKKLRTTRLSAETPGSASVGSLDVMS